MKIVCPNCSAKYSIADEKVQGKKVFKIKCKRCQEDIIVRAEQMEAEASSAAAAPPHDDDATRVSSSLGGTGALWHLVIDGEQKGPYSNAQVRELIGSGAVDAETYVWADGFADWRPLREVPELAALYSAVAAPSPAGLPPMSAPGPMAPAAAPAAEARARVDSRAMAGPDLFGAPPAAAAVVPPEPAPLPASGLTGQRNENSVLFSLQTLQNLSKPEGAKPSEPPKSAGSDQSGLIDIKSMSSTLASPGPRRAVDDLLTVGSAASASPLAPPQLAPVVPVAPPAEPKGHRSAAAIGGAIVAAGALVAGTIFYVNGKSHDGNENPAAATAAAPMPTTPPSTALAPTTPPAPAPMAAAAAPGNAAAAPAAPRPRTPTSAPSDRPRESTSSRSNAPAPPPVAAPPPAAPPPAAAGASSNCTSRCHGNLDCLLRCSTEASARPAANPSAPAAAPSAAATSGPETPSRDDVLRALTPLRGSVQACGQGQTGTAMVSITFGSSGHVTQATVGPPFSGTPAGSCIARAVRSATVPQFTRATFTVNYPFVIQ